MKAVEIRKILTELLLRVGVWWLDRILDLLFIGLNRDSVL